MVFFAGIQMADQLNQQFLWTVFYTTWTQSCAGDLLSEADTGRLWWLAEPLLRRMEKVGLLDACDRHEGRCENLCMLIWLIRTILWAFCSGEC